MTTMEILSTVKITSANTAPGFRDNIPYNQRLAMEELNEGLLEKMPKRIQVKLSTRCGYISEWRNAEPLTTFQRDKVIEIMRQHYEEKLGCEVRIRRWGFGACEGGYNLFFPIVK